MKAKHARQIRLGIQMSRMESWERTMLLHSRRVGSLTFRAYCRENLRIVDRMIARARRDL